jgi:hypothetical protein
MKHSDPVMQELWEVKDSAVKQHGSLTNYVAYLRTLAKKKPSVKRLVAVPSKTAMNRPE